MAKAEVIITATDRTQAALQSAQKGLKGLDNSAMLLQRTLGALGGVAIGRFFLNTANQALTMADNINKAAIRANITTEAMSELAYAAKLADTDMNSIVRSINLMQRGLGEASVGAGEARKALEMLGIPLKTLEAMAPEEQFKFLADAIMSLKSPTEQMTVGTKIFGRSFAELLPLFADGAEGMNKAAEEARRLNLVIGQEQADAASEAKDAIDKLTGAWEGFTVMLVSKVAPALTSILNEITGLQPAEVQLTRAIAEVERLKTTLAGLPGTGGQFGEQLRQQLADQIEIIRKLQEQASGSAIGGAAFKTEIQAPAEMLNFYETQAFRDLQAREAALKPFGKMEAEWFESVRMQIIETSDKTYEELQKIQADIPELTKNTVDQITVFAEQAARNMQSSFANFLFDPFQNGLKGMLKGFVDTIRRMVAEFAASQLMKFFFTPFATGSGLLASFAKFAIGGKAMGGSVLGSKPYIVGERGPELFVPGSNGSIVPNDRMGGVTVAPVYNIDARGATADLQKALPGILQENNRRIFDELDRRYGIGR